MSPQITWALLVGPGEGKGCDLGTCWRPAPLPPAGRPQTWSCFPETPRGRAGYRERLGKLKTVGETLACLFRTGQLDVTIPGK